MNKELNGRHIQTKVGIERRVFRREDTVNHGSVAHITFIIHCI